MITLPELSFEQDALEPHMSRETLEYHYGKHHRAYVTNLNGLIEGTDLQDLPLEELVLKTEGGTFNNAAQAFNHGFFWSCLSPNGGGAPTGKLAELIDRDFGSFDSFKQKFTETAVKTFGSGWAWLVQNNEGRLEVVSTSNAGTPLTDAKTPLLTCDVWEHAYYIDYRNARPKFVEAFFNLVNWDFASSQLR